MTQVTVGVMPHDGESGTRKNRYHVDPMLVSMKFSEFADVISEKKKNPVRRAGCSRLAFAHVRACRMVIFTTLGTEATICVTCIRASRRILTCILTLSRVRCGNEVSVHLAVSICMCRESHVREPLDGRQELSLSGS